MANTKKGQTNNPNGRPRVALAEELRRNPKVKAIIDKVIETAHTLNTKEEHPQAYSCAKVLMDKCVPSLKAQEIDVSGGMQIQMPKIVIKGKDG